MDNFSVAFLRTAAQSPFSQFPIFSHQTDRFWHARIFKNIFVRCIPSVIREYLWASHEDRFAAIGESATKDRALY